MLALLAVPAAGDDDARTANAQPPQPAAPAVPNGEPCPPLDREKHTWLDKSRDTVYATFCGTAAWFDGFFGDYQYEESPESTYGRLGVSTFYDERDHLDNDLRLRARFALPALRDRVDLLVGRGDEEELIEERTSTQYDEIPSSFDRFDDESFLIGLGYSEGQGLKRGFRFSVGARVRTPIETYAKGTYRRAWQLGERSLVRVRPIMYWRSEEGFGSTLHVDADRFVRDSMMLRWGNSANISEDDDVEGVELSSALTLYQALSNRRGLTYRLLVRGETNADVHIQDYGFEWRYRQRILRKWLFVEFVNSATWPREFRSENRDMNLGVGIGLEMYFGNIPEQRMF